MRMMKIKGIYNTIIPTIMIILGLWVLFFFIGDGDITNAYDSENPRESQGNLGTPVSVTIVDDFLGYVKRGQSLGNQFFTGNMRWTNSPNIYVRVGANRTSSYQLTGGVKGFWAGNGIDAYDKSQFTILSGEDGIKNIYTDYTNIGGIYHTGVVPVGLDRIGPSKPYISFTTGVIMRSPFTIRWTDGNTDTGVGREKYVIHISLDPSFSGEVKKDLYAENYYMDTNDLPLGTIRRYIESIDYLGNSTPSNVQYFHNTLPSIPPGSNVPDELDEYYHNIATDRPIQDLSPGDIKNIFDVMDGIGTGKKVVYDNDDIKSILIYEYLVHGSANIRSIPTGVPKTGVDGIMKYLDKIVQDVNNHIQNPEISPHRNRSYMIVGLLLLILCFVIIVRSGMGRIDKVCNER